MYKCPQRRAPACEAGSSRSIPFLKRTFSHLRGIGPRAEPYLGSLGITPWEELHRPHSRTKCRETLQCLQIEFRVFRESRCDLPATFLPQRIAWRATCHFPGGTAFIGAESHQRGARPHVTLHALHLDVMVGLRRLEYAGGLKKIEQRLGILRNPLILSPRGRDAVRLSRCCQAENEKAFSKFIVHDQAEFRSLQTLAGLNFDQRLALLEFTRSKSGELRHD